MSARFSHPQSLCRRPCALFCTIERARFCAIGVELRHRVCASFCAIEQRTMPPEVADASKWTNRMIPMDWGVSTVWWLLFGSAIASAGCTIANVAVKGPPLCIASCCTIARCEHFFKM